MKKRIPALLLVLCLALSVPALAADSMENFRKVRVYDNSFSDVAADFTFYSNIQTLYEYGLTVGRDNGTFGAGDSVTVGQAVIFAGRVRSIYRTGDAETGPTAYIADGQSAYQPYLTYLQEEGVLGTELDGTYSAAATRAQVAHILASVLPESALPPVNDELVTQAYASRKFITDVTEYTPYYQDILTLYKCGVAVGSDARGTYYPGSAITRGALSALLTRMFRAELRLTPGWDLLAAYSAEGSTYAGLVDAVSTCPSSPNTSAEMDQAIRYLISHGVYQIKLKYSGLTSAGANTITQLALTTVKSYCEQGYNTANCFYNTTTGQITLTFSAADLTVSQTAGCRSYALSAAIAAHDALWNSGQITASMSEYEKARVYYDWIFSHCAYDYGADDTSISHLPYAVFKNAKAVCDGYTGAYNLLLKLEGIDCTALGNETHIWTVATLDGESYHIDTTWGDAAGGATNYQYFGMSESQSWNYHSW